MPAIHRTITTSASPESAWTFLSDFTTTEQWDPPTERTERVSGEASGGVGTVYDNTTQILGRDVEIRYTVAEFEPPRRMVLHGESSSFTAVDTIVVHPATGGSMVEYTADFTYTGLAKLATPVAAVGLEHIGDDAAAQMKRCLDAL